VLKRFSLLDSFSGMFGDLFGFKSKQNPSVQETDEFFRIFADMPGMEIEVNLDGDTLTMSGRRELRSGADERKYAYKLASSLDKDKISATYTDGVLAVTIPKRPPPEQPEPRTIKVEVK